ncbi:Bromodomain containing protein 7 [Perkinsus olseni]|uniref:Bromodomain containing protein 7 n=1 Tax=Perkinsus olseni TaxID=32597 RepID=A0A7J6P0N1_PEROL|nr:Bromodomain containing protein 7 [Perkinsus olseni]
MVLTPARKRQNSEPAASEASTAHDRPEDTVQAKRRRTGGSHNPQVFGISQRQWRQKSYRDLCAVMLRWMRSKDRNQFFYFPVDVNEVPTYRDIIKNPMSFDLMEARASKRAYKTVDDIQKDFKLICKNAMTFNPEGSIWYRAAEKLLAEGEKQFDLAQLHGLRLPDESMESAPGAATSRAGSRRSYTRRDHGIFILKALDEALFEGVLPGTAQMHRNSTEVEKIPPSIRNAMHGIEYSGTPLNMTKDLLEAYANVVEENRFSNRGAPNMLGHPFFRGELEPKSAEKSMRRFLDGIEGLPEDLVERHLRKRLDGCKSVVAPLNDCRVFGLDTEDFVAFNGTLRVEREFTGYILGVGYENAMQAAGLSDTGVDTVPLKEMAQRHRAAREKQIQSVRGNEGWTGPTAAARQAYLTPATTSWSARYNQSTVRPPVATTPYNQAAQWAALNQANRTAHLRAQQQASARTRPAVAAAGQSAFPYRTGMQQVFSTTPSLTPGMVAPPAGSALAEFQQRLASASPEQQQMLLRSLDCLMLCLSSTTADGGTVQSLPSLVTASLAGQPLWNVVLLWMSTACVVVLSLIYIYLYFRPVEPESPQRATKHIETASTEEIQRVVEKGVTASAEAQPTDNQERRKSPSEEEREKNQRLAQRASDCFEEFSNSTTP